MLAATTSMGLALPAPCTVTADLRTEGRTTTTTTTAIGEAPTRLAGSSCHHKHHPKARPSRPLPLSPSWTLAEHARESHPSKVMVSASAGASLAVGSVVVPWGSEMEA